MLAICNLSHAHFTTFVHIKIQNRYIYLSFSSNTQIEIIRKLYYAVQHIEYVVYRWHNIICTKNAGHLQHITCTLHKICTYKNTK